MANEHANCYGMPAAVDAHNQAHSAPATYTPSTRLAMARWLHPAPSQRACCRHSGRPRSIRSVSCSYASSEMNICKG